ncbi:hypothetical protein NQ315_010735 [Exocentrus adspersus]|uniref:Tetraspanin n=1 Tax=Exocentrus adspersus TaxID=1586481 RepID=A0AAV8VVB1_9CUCU|nr:hypothetical protein NQ315_010735 [Exocentrus adspersus]
MFSKGICIKTCLKVTNLFFIVSFLVIAAAEINYGARTLTKLYKINREDTFESQLDAYSVVLLVLGFVEISAGVFTVLQRESTNIAVSNHLLEDFTNLFIHYNSNSTYQQQVDALQSQFFCCGILSYTDWTNGLPATCCEPVGLVNGECFPSPFYQLTTGCAVLIPKLIFYWNSIIGYSLVGVGTFEVLVSMLGFCLGWGRFSSDSNSKTVAEDKKPFFDKFAITDNVVSLLPKKN